MRTRLRPVHPFTVTHRDIWSIALPATIAFITEPVAGLVDLTVIGRLGDANLLAGLVLGTMAFGFIIAFAYFLRIGTAGLVAQAVGAQEGDEGFIHFARAALSGIAIGVILLALTLPLIWISRLVLAPEPQTITPFETYFSVRLWSAPMVLINFALLGWFYGRARAATGMALQFVVHGGNIVFSIWFVYGLGLGVRGAALGTVLAESLAAGTGLFLVVRHMGLKRIAGLIGPEKLFEIKAVKRMFALSRDLMIRTVVLESSFVIFLTQLSRAGTAELAGNTILLNLVMFIAFFLDGQAQAAEQICGKAVGANYQPAFDRALLLAHIWGYVVCLVLCLGLLVSGPALISLMTTAQEVRDAAHAHFVIAALVSITGVMPFVMDGVMTGATLNTLIRNGMVAAFCIYLIGLWILQPLFGLNGLWLSMHLFFIARGVIFLVAVQMKKPKLFSDHTA